MTAPEPLTYTLPAAAEKLGGIFTVDFLKKNLHRLPHLKSGAGTGRAGRVGFSEEQLKQVIEICTVDPAPAEPAESFPSMVTRRRASARPTTQRRPA